jgi:hypothetical protein
LNQSPAAKSVVTRHSIAAVLEGTEIRDPYVVLTVDRQTPRSVDASPVEPTDLDAVGMKCVHKAVTLGSDPNVSLRIDSSGLQRFSEKA